MERLKNAQLQDAIPHAPYTLEHEREYVKAEGFSVRFYLASTQLIIVHLGKVYTNLKYN